MSERKSETTHPYSPETLAVLECIFLISESGHAADLKEVDELLRLKHGLLESDADEWFATAAREGAIECGPDRRVQ
jgi:hypothetical protein